MNMYRLAVGTTFALVAAAFAQGAELSADFSVETGAVRRALHSSGYAPMIAGFGNLPAQIKSLNFDSVRTHDLALVNAGQRVVDAHFIFPLMNLDATNPSNYYFKATDYLLELSRNIGLDIFYRLGTSIEHSGRVHFNAQIPPDIDTPIPADVVELARLRVMAAIEKNLEGRRDAHGVGCNRFRVMLRSLGRAEARASRTQS